MATVRKIEWFHQILLLVLCWSSGSAVTTVMGEVTDDGGRDTAPDRLTGGSPLTLTEASPRRIRGHYSSSDGGGIIFDVDTSDDHHSLSITTQQGVRVLAYKQHKLEEETLLGISLFDHHFLVSYDKRTLGRREYLVPKPFQRYFDPVLKRAEVLRYLRKDLDEEGANETRSTAIGQLLASKEATLVVQAARALGERGVRGSDNPAAMMFYILALHVQNLLGRTGDDREGSMQNSWDSLEVNSLATERKHTARHASYWIGRTQGKDFCSNTNRWCPSGKCSEGDECKGLCGTNCTCWIFVCGNCCLNKMCFDHDAYCTEDGILSWCCLGIVTDEILGNVGCDKPYTC